MLWLSMLRTFIFLTISIRSINCILWKSYSSRQ